MKKIASLMILASCVLLTACVHDRYYSDNQYRSGYTQNYQSDMTSGYNRDYQPRKHKRIMNQNYSSSQTPVNGGGYNSSVSGPNNGSMAGPVPNGVGRMNQGYSSGSN